MLTRIGMFLDLVFLYALSFLYVFLALFCVCGDVQPICVATKLVMLTSQCYGIFINIMQSATNSMFIHENFLITVNNFNSGLIFFGGVTSPLTQACVY